MYRPGFTTGLGYRGMVLGDNLNSVPAGKSTPWCIVCIVWLPSVSSFISVFPMQHGLPGEPPSAIPPEIPTHCSNLERRSLPLNAAEEFLLALRDYRLSRVSAT